MLLSILQHRLTKLFKWFFWFNIDIQDSLMKGIKFLFIISGIIFGLIFAEGVMGITISPLTFELTANPGDILNNKLKVYNPTDSVIIVRMEIEDFKAIGEEGQVVVTPEEEATYSLKKWTITEPTEFTLESREQEFINFIIEIPEDAEPGGKYGSVLATVGGVIGEEGFTGSAIAQKVGALVLLTVAGEVKEDLSIKEFTAPSFLEYGPVPFLIRFENKGTIHVRPRGFVTITNWRSKKVADVEFPQLNVIPGAARRVETEWENKWLFGKYTATLVGSYGTANLPFNPPVLTFWVFPWRIALVIVLALSTIIFVLYITRKRWRLAIKILVKGEKSNI